MKRPELLKKIMRAKEEIGVAEGELEDVLRDMMALPPPTEKVVISQVIEDAFQKLSAAKERLVSLEGLLKEE